MKEYGIIRLESIDFLNNNFYKIAEIFKKEKISVEGTNLYSKSYNDCAFDLVDSTYRYLVYLVSGEKINFKLDEIKNEFNKNRKDINQQIYVSSKEKFSSDLLKYFKIENLDQIEILPFREKTLAIIKPDGYKNKNEIIQMILDSGLRIIDYKEMILTPSIIRDHYSHLLDEPFYNKLESYMLSDKVAIMILEGYDAINKYRDLMGSTDSTKAEKNTIRGKFGTDITYNAVHGSDSKESAKKEIERFFGQEEKTLKKRI